MPKKRNNKSDKDPISGYQTFKEVLLDYQTDANEAKKRYLKTLKSSKMKGDKILTELPDFIIKKKLKEGVHFIKKFLEDESINIKELSIVGVKKRLSKNKKLTHKKKDKTILVPTGFSDRDYFSQLMHIQHQYKILAYSNSRGHGKANEDIGKSSLQLTVIAIKADYPRYLTEDLYNRYKLSLEAL